METVPGNSTPEALGYPRIYRQVTFDLATFDLLKEHQRRLSEDAGRPLSNSETLRVLVFAIAPA